MAELKTKNVKITVEPVSTDSKVKSVSAETITSTLKEKFTSRKFILSLVGVIVGICGMIGFNDNTVAIIAFAALEVLSIVAYIIMEGKVDANAVKDIAEIITDLADMISQAQKGETVTEPETRPSDDILHTLPASASENGTTANTDSTVSNE